MFRPGIDRTTLSRMRECWPTDGAKGDLGERSRQESFSISLLVSSPFTALSANYSTTILSMQMNCNIISIFSEIVLPRLDFWHPKPDLSRGFQAEPGLQITSLRSVSFRRRNNRWC